MGKRVLKWIAGTLTALLLLAAGLWVLLFRVNTFYIAVELMGAPSLTLEYGEAYTEEGARVLLRGTRFFREGFSPQGAVLEICGRVDSKALGQQVLVYEGAFHSWKGRAQRIVTIADTTPPVITLVPDPQEPELPYQEAGFSAVDNADGVLTGQVKREEFPGLILYSVADSSGNEATVSREIPYHHPDYPLIRLEGGKHFRHPAGTVYAEPGFSAEDRGLDLTGLVQVEGSVDWLTPGSYPVTYSVTDPDGNITTLTRMVEVTAAPRPETVFPEEKTVYLTFDDGPGPYTLELLDILDGYGAKATFFVVNTEDNQLLKEIVRRGHSIGIHSVTHDYASIYASPQAYFQDLKAMQQVIFQETGILTTLMRFPGGSSNTVSRHACKGIMTKLTQAVQDAGFQYFDWNVDSGDAGSAHTARQVRENVTAGIQELPVALVLQHDIHRYSVSAVADILQWGTENGYAFKPLRYNSPGFHHEVQN